MLKMLFMLVMAMTTMAIVYEWSFREAGGVWGEVVLAAAVEEVVVAAVVVGLLGAGMDPHPDVRSTE